MFSGKVALLRNTGDNAHNADVFIHIVPEGPVGVDGIEGAVGGETLDKHAIGAGAHHILPGVGGE